MRSKSDDKTEQHRKTVGGGVAKSEVTVGTPISCIFLGPNGCLNRRKEEEEYGVRRTIKRQDPKEPSREEREEHEKTHIPCKSF